MIVEVLQQSFCLILRDGRDHIIDVALPEQNWTRRILEHGFFYHLHCHFGDRDGDGGAHWRSLNLLVDLTFPLEEI